MNKEEITIKYLNRYPDSKHTKSFDGCVVHIVTDRGMLRHGGAGYTFDHYADAGIFSFDRARNIIEDLGPEKRAKLVKRRHYFTDYPIEELGDLPHSLAPIREIKPIHYDGNKYVTFMVVGCGKVYSCKSGYIYSENGRFGKVPCADTSIFTDPKLLPRELTQ